MDRTVESLHLRVGDGFGGVSDLSCPLAQPSGAAPGEFPKLSP